MKRVTMMVFVVGTLVGGGRAVAQGPAAAPDTTARRTAMERLAFLQGKWSGDATAMIGQGQKVQIRQTESVRYALNGQVMLVEGVGRKLVDGIPGDTLFHAVATIDWLPERGYRMRAYTLSGHFGEFPLNVVDRGFAWEAPAPGGKVEYTMKLTDAGVWDERGDYVRGDQRYEVIRMLVRPVAAQP